MHELELVAFALLDQSLILGEEIMSLDCDVEGG